MISTAYPLRNSRIAIAIVGVITLIFGMTLVFIPANSAQAATGPNPFATITLDKQWDGTGFDTDEATFVNSANGFFPGDDNATDGVVSSRDTVGYGMNISIWAGPARTVDIKITVPEFLQLDSSANRNMCLSTAGIKGTFNPSLPGCTYDVGAGQSFSVGTVVTLNSKDTAGLVKEGQVLSAGVGLSKDSPYSTVKADAVTVVSAPTADLLIRPSQCTVYGTCTAASYGETTGAFIIFPQVLKFAGYSTTKGGTDSSQWSATFDPFGMPSGTTYSVNGTPLTINADGAIDLTGMVGEVKVDYTVPANWGGADFQEGENRDFPVRITNTDDAFATADYLNNGDGWEPGQGQASGFSTYNLRNSGSRIGYYYPNNNFTMVKVYRPITPSGIALKTIARPYSPNYTFWDPANMFWGEGGTEVEFGNHPFVIEPRKVSAGTQIKSRVSVFPGSHKEAIPSATVVLADTWDPKQLLLSGRPQILDAAGNPVTDLDYTIQWSNRKLTGDQIYDPNTSDGWITSTPPVTDPSSVYAVRAILRGVTLGQGSTVSKYTLEIPQKVGKFDQVMPPASLPDFGYVSVSGDSGITYRSSVDNYVTPVTPPTPRVDLTGSVTTDLTGNSTEVNRGDPSIYYTYQPVVSGLRTSLEEIAGSVTIDLDPCLTDFVLTSPEWELVGDITLGSGCMTDDPKHGVVTLQPVGGSWLPSNNWDNAKATATMSKITFTGQANPIAIGDLKINATWNLTNPDNAAPAEASKELLVNAPDFTLTNPTLSTSTPKVEIGDPLKFTASIVSRTSPQTVASEAIVIMPGRGSDAHYKDLLAEVSGNGSYGEGGEPTESTFSGSYEVKGISIVAEQSVSGSYVMCTTKANPSMDPADYDASDWTMDCARADITAAKIVQPAAVETSGARIAIDIQPTGNKVGDNYLMWMGPIYVEGAPRSMVWPVNDVVVSSSISGYVYWDIWGKGQDRNADSPPIAEIAVQLFDKATDAKVGQTVTDEDGYYQFTDLHSGNYYTKLGELGADGAVPKQVGSSFDPERMIDVSQTFSYRTQRLENAKLTSTDIALGIEATVPNVNFGFTAPDPYSDLKKDAAPIRCDEGGFSCAISWDVTVKNGGSGFTADRAVDIVGAGGQNGQWAVQTEQGMFYNAQSNSWAQRALPVGETVAAITGGSTKWLMATTSGKVYSAGISTANWTDVSLPGGETAVAVGGVTTDSYGSWAVVSESGNVYQRGVLATDWTVRPAPNGEKAIAISRGDFNATYWGVIMESGKFYTLQISTGTWTDKTLPAGDKAVAVAGMGWDGTNWGVVTDTGKVLQSTTTGTSWTNLGLPEGEKAVGITGDGRGGGGSAWGIVTESGKVFQRAVSTSSSFQWAERRLPIGELAVAISGDGPSTSTNLWGIVTESGQLYTSSSVQVGGSWTPYPVPPWHVDVPEFTGSPVTLTGGRLTDTTSNVVYDVEARIDGNVIPIIAERVNADFIVREFKLPNLEPGKDVLVQISGKVNRPSNTGNGQGLVIGNQAAETFTETPRGLPAITPPALPSFSTGNPEQYGKWTGNTGCTATPDWVVPGDQCDQVYAQVPPTDQPLGALAGYTWFDEDSDGTMDDTEPRLINVRVSLFKGENGQFSLKVGELLTDGDGYYDFTSLVPSTETDIDGYYVLFQPVKDPQLSTGGTLLQPGQSWAWTDPYQQAPWYATDRSAANTNGSTHNVPVVASEITQPVNGGLKVVNTAIEVIKGHVEESEESASVWSPEPYSPDLDGETGKTVATKVTVKSTNTGSEPLENLVFADVSDSGANVAWEKCTIGGTDYPLTGDWTKPDDGSRPVYEVDLVGAVLPVGESMTCEGTLAPFAVDDEVQHKDTVAVTGTGQVSGAEVSDDDPFTAEVNPEEIPVPTITLEKGIAQKAEGAPEGTKCSTEEEWEDPVLCDINPGGPGFVLPVGKPTVIVFRVHNTGKEPLLDMTLADVTLIGEAQVEDISCNWPTQEIAGATRRYLAVGDYAVCNGKLTVIEPATSHKNEAEVYAVGQVSHRLTDDKADFEGRTSASVALPMTGGQGALLFFVLAGLGGVASLVVFRRSRSAVVRGRHSR